MLTPYERAEMVTALSAIQKRIRWKPNKGIRHLEKRKRMGHLPPHYSLEDYNKVISSIVKDGQNLAYLYEFAGERYYAVRGPFKDREWLVIFSREGIMETAFPPEEMEQYLERRGFMFVGRIKEVLKWSELKGSSKNSP
jgi:hypothetical protein